MFKQVEFSLPTSNLQDVSGKENVKIIYLRYYSQSSFHDQYAKKVSPINSILLKSPNSLGDRLSSAARRYLMRGIPKKGV